MSEPLKLRVWGAFAPDGSPESDYFKASVRHGPNSEQFKAAEKRLTELGCPVFTSDYDPVWNGSKWTLVKR